jgi:membrane-bound lytic murein transglycosylase D
MRSLFLLSFLAIAPGLAAADAPAKKPAPAAPTDELYDLGKSLFDQYAPPEVKEQYEFPSRASWDSFAVRLQQALDGDKLDDLAGYEDEARAALTAARVIPGYEDYADWLSERLDYIEAAKQVTGRRPAPRPGLRPAPGFQSASVPYYDLWVERLRGRPAPVRAAELMPGLRAAFVAEGVPPELAWLAEVESTLDPAARSPAGAKGLFQFMPGTAQSLGLSTFLPDDRTNAEKSAHAAARYLAGLHEKFGDWPLAFAAYNSGEGRVRRLLDARGAKSFAEISGALSAETRMYVPKVCATIAVRTGITPDKIAAPRG